LPVVLSKKNEPAAYELINSTGRGKVILIADHASNRIPQSLKNLGLNNQILDSHLAWDPGTAIVAKALSIVLDAPLIMANYSHLVIDCNRAPDNKESIVPIKDGIPIPGNKNLSEDEKLHRKTEIFDPYHRAISELMDERRHYCDCLISIHSFSPMLNKNYQPCKIGIGSGEDERLSALLLQALAKRQIHSVGKNTPFAINKNIDYSVPHHAGSRKLPHVMLQFRNDTLNEIEGVVSQALIVSSALESAAYNLSTLQETELIVA